MSTSAGTVTINSVDLSLDGAWKLEDGTVLLGEGPQRGSDRVVPGTAGVAYRAKVRDALRVPLVLYVYGEKDQAGSSHSNVWDGLRDNVNYLQTNLLASNVGEVTCSYTFPDTTSMTGNCYVDDLLVAPLATGVAVARCVLGVVLTGGRLA